MLADTFLPYVGLMLVDADVSITSVGMQPRLVHHALDKADSVRRCNDSSTKKRRVNLTCAATLLPVFANAEPLVLQPAPSLQHHVIKQQSLHKEPELSKAAR